MKNLVFSIIFFAAGLFLFYGAYVTYSTAKTHSQLQYSKIVEEKIKIIYKMKSVYNFIMNLIEVE